MNTRPRQPYITDITDEQWALLEPLLLAFEDRVRPGPPRDVDLREVVNTLRYQNRTGCQWALLPHDLSPKALHSRKGSRGSREWLERGDGNATCYRETRTDRR